MSTHELGKLTEAERLNRIWKFGRGDNFLKKPLARFFSRPENFGATNSLERKLANAFNILLKNGFTKWFDDLENLKDDRKKAEALEFLPGSKLKVSRDFLNNIGMTDTLIPLDIHILGEMNESWGWSVPSNTPSDRSLYEEIEDAVKEIAGLIGCTVIEIDKAIFSARTHDSEGRARKFASPNSSLEEKTFWKKHSTPLTRQSKKSGKIWSEIYPGKDLSEIQKENPFASSSWLNDTVSFSSKRRAPVKALFENGPSIGIVEIRRRSQNSGRYAAFRAIAHGIAVWDKDNQELVKVSDKETDSNDEE